MPCHTKKVPPRSKSAKVIENGAGHIDPRLPIIYTQRRANPRMSAMASAMPVAAETERIMRKPGHLCQIAHGRSRVHRIANWYW